MSLEDGYGWILWTERFIAIIHNLINLPDIILPPLVLAAKK